MDATVKSEAVLLCRTTDVPDGGMKQVPKPGTDDFLTVYNLGGKYYLADDMCTHAMASLSTGEINDGKIYCPLHGGAFDIATGAPAEYPCTEPLKTYAIFEEHGNLFGVIK